MQYPSIVVMQGVIRVILGDWSRTVHPKLSSCPADRILLDSRVISAAWCTMMMISPSWVRTTPPAVTSRRFDIVWSSIPLRSIVLSSFAIIRISCPAIDPFAPRSTRADHPIQDVFLSPVLLVEVWLMENVWSFTADGGTLRG